MSRRNHWLVKCSICGHHMWLDVYGENLGRCLAVVGAEVHVFCNRKECQFRRQLAQQFTFKTKLTRLAR